MQGDVEAVLFVAETDQAEPRQRSSNQVDRPPGILGGQPQCLRFPFDLRQRAQIHDGQRDPGDRLNDLDRLAPHDRHRRTPGLVAPQDLAQAPLEGRHIEGTDPVDGQWFVVERQPGGHLAVQPDLMLAGGEGRGQACGSARNEVVSPRARGNVPAQVLFEEAAFLLRERSVGDGWLALDAHRRGPGVTGRTGVRQP